MPLQCPRCGTHNEDGKEACAVCGTPLSSAATVTAPAAPAAPQAADPRGPSAVADAPPGPAAGQAPQPPQQAAPQAGAPAEQMRAGLPVVPSPGGQQPPASPQTDELESFLLEGTVDTSLPGLAAEGAETAAEAPVVQQPTGPFPQPAFGAWPMPYNPYGQYPQYTDYMSPYGFGFPPMSPYGAYGPYPSFGFFPPMPFFGGYPPYGPPYMPPYPPPMGGYPGYGAPSPYPGQYPQAYPGAPRKRIKTVYIVLIIVLSLLVVGGAVTAAVLLTGSGSSAFKLGDGSVTGTDIDFRGLLLTQKEGSLTLTGTYDNNTKREGDVFVTVQGITKGSEQLISFTVPVEPGKGKSFSQKKSSSAKLTGATLGALIYKGSTDSSDTGTNTYPWDTGTTPTNPSTSPLNETSPSNPGTENTTPSF